MSAWDIVVPLVALIAGAAVTAVVLRHRHGGPGALPAAPRILFPFVGAELSDRALEASLRLARAEHAVVVPAYLARVPLPLTLDAPVGRACDEAFAIFEEIERRAVAYAVPVDGRIVRGRNVRHAMRELVGELPHARRIVVAAASAGRHDGFSIDDVAWLLRNAPGEVLVLRPAGARPRALRPGGAAGAATPAHRPAHHLGPRSAAADDRHGPGTGRRRRQHRPFRADRRQPGDTSG